MSSCQIIEFKDGKATDGPEYSNSLGGQPRVWNSLCKRYLASEHWLMKSEPLFNLLKTPSPLSRVETIVHLSMCDHAVVFADDFKEYTAALREFIKVHPAHDRVCHLLAWADHIDTLECEAIAFQGTSVVDDFWYIWEIENEGTEEETEEYVAYDLKTGDKHWDIFKEGILSKKS